LHAFLESGLNAFRSLCRADEFLETILQRERKLMLSLFSPNQAT